MKDIELQLYIRTRDDTANADQIAREVHKCLEALRLYAETGTFASVTAIHVVNPETQLRVT